MEDYKNLSADQIREFAENGAGGLRKAANSSNALNNSINIQWDKTPQGDKYWESVYSSMLNGRLNIDAMAHLAAWADTLEVDARGESKQTGQSEKIKELEEKVQAAMEEFSGHTLPILNMIEKLTKRVSALESASNQENSEPNHPGKPETSPWHLEVDDEEDIFNDWRVLAYQSNYGIFNRYMTSQGPVAVPIFQKFWKTHAEADHCIKAHRMQWRLAQIEKAAREKWGDWVKYTGSPTFVINGKNIETFCNGKLVCINHRELTESRKGQITEIIRLMEGRENLELALKGPWRV